MKKIAALVTLLSLVFLLPMGVWSDPTMIGPTGLFLVPSPRSVPQGHFAGGIYLDQYSQRRQDVETHTRGFINGIYGVNDNFEIGFHKGVDNKNFTYDPSLTINMKYVFPDSKVVKVACGGIIETDNNNYSSAYMLAGAEVAYFGLGFNFGGHANYSMNRAHFGSYNFTKRRPETFFFLAGAEFDLKIAIMSVEYNSDSFVVGFRVPSGEGYNFNIGYRSSSDYDRLHQETLGPSYERKGLFLGFSGVF
jgi:hypothetical protein